MVRSKLQAKILSRRQTRKRLEVSFFTLDGWHKEAILTALTADGRAVAYSRQEVEAFLRNGGPHRKKPGRKPNTLKNLSTQLA